MEGGRRLFAPCTTLLDGPKDSVVDVCFNCNDTLLAAACWDGALYVWRQVQPGGGGGASEGCTDTGSGEAGAATHTHTHTPLRGLPGTTASQHQQVVCATRTSLATMQGVSIEEHVPAWEMKRKLVGHTDALTSVAFHPSDRNLVASGSKDRSARLWDCSTGEAIMAIYQHHERVADVCFSADGSQIVTGSWDCSAAIHATAASAAGPRTQPQPPASVGEPRAPCVWLRGAHTDWIQAVAASPCGSYICTGSADTTAVVWDAATGAALHTLAGHTRAVHSVQFLAPLGAAGGGGDILTGSKEGNIKRWAGPGFECAQTLEQTLYPRDQFSVWKISVCGRLRNGGRHVAASGNTTTPVVWDLATGQILYEFPGHIKLVQAVAYNSGGSFVATASYDKTVRVFCTGVFGAWTVGNHRLLGPRCNEVLLTILLCDRRLSAPPAAHEGAGRGNVLPTEVWLFIFSHLQGIDYRGCGAQVVGPAPSEKSRADRYSFYGNKGMCYEY